MWVDYAARQVLGSVGAFVRAPRLRVAARQSQNFFPATGETVISLTTHGKRITSAVVAISSLLVGTQRVPVHLWLDVADYDSAWPKGLNALVERGLQVHCSDGAYGPHTKYYGTFQRFAGTGTRVVTVDDDMIYPRWFLEKLLNSAQADPGCVVAYRAHEITMVRGRIAPYRQWKTVRDTEPSHRHFATGVSGVAYPASMVDYVAAEGTSFLEHAPQADDVWLNACALRSGHPVRQVFPHPREFSLVPGSQSVALVRANLRGGNDLQIANTYTAADERALNDSVHA
ncbi:glycosyltransferase [Corynebacterium sp.]|uniref:glycosyltransferase n=1 Tax=Corynebacterium sp. TaxID=1720 RepID=UPI002A909CF8|nr:glycosyltransferase [Corynebacterium sp.]MDY5784785.1 glycosyltransferase [Corynebacterium sp.]